ncbi:MAG: flagellar motor switch protein FliM [Desulfuromonadia bacterium]
MEHILTRDEIEALLTAVFEGRIDPDRELEKPAGEAATYDLFSTNAFSGFVPNMDLIYDSFIRYNRVTLSSRLRKMVEIHKGSSRAYKFDDFLQTLPTPVCLVIFKIDPLKGAALIAMDAPMVFSIVDSILGGGGSLKLPDTERMFTSIELKLVERVLRDIFADMEKAWSPLISTHMSLVKIEMNPRLVNIVPPEYQVVSTGLEYQIEQAKGNVTVVVPYMTIDPIRDKLKPGTQFDLLSIDPEWTKRLSRELLEAPVEVVATLGSSTITMAELLSLSVGDTVVLNESVDTELSVTVERIRKFTAVAGVSHGNSAIMISKVISTPEGGSDA